MFSTLASAKLRAGVVGVAEDERSAIIVRESDGTQFAVNASALLGWVGAIVLWAILCSAAWFVSTRDDYANLATARTCAGEKFDLRDAKCIGIKSPADYMNEVNRKARNSRLSSAAGAAIAALAIFFSRRKKPN